MTEGADAEILSFDFAQDRRYAQSDSGDSSLRLE